MPKASAGCIKSLAKFTDPAKGTRQKLHASVLKTCTSPDLSKDDILANAGLGFGTAAARCDQLDVPPLDSPSRIVQCAVAQDLCEASRILTLEVPRGREILELYGILLTTGFFSGP